MHIYLCIKSKDRTALKHQNLRSCIFFRFKPFPANFVQDLHNLPIASRFPDLNLLIAVSIFINRKYQIFRNQSSSPEMCLEFHCVMLSAFYLLPLNYLLKSDLELQMN